MRLGILADTHDKIERTRRAVELLTAAGADAFAHCGDFVNPQMLRYLTARPLYFVFGNNDCDTVRDLQLIANELGQTCLGWGGEITLDDKRIALVHGHLTSDLKPLLAAEPDYLLSGHSHLFADTRVGKTRRINPGALHRAATFSVAILDLPTDELQFLAVPR